MTILKLASVLIVLNLIQNIKAIKVSNNTFLIYPDENLHQAYDFSEGRVLYAVYPKEPRHAQKKFFFVGEKTFKGSDRYSCSVKLKPFGLGQNIDFREDIKRWGDDKVIIFWEALSTNYTILYSVISIINLSKCEVTSIRINIEKRADYLFIVPYLDTLDVFFKNWDFYEVDLYRITANDRGQILEGPTVFTEAYEPKLLQPLSKTSPGKGFFYAERADYCNYSEYALIKPDGLIKKLTQFPLDREVTVSTEHDVITACHEISGDKGIINCTQYDMDGNFRFQTIVNKINESDIYPPKNYDAAYKNYLGSSSNYRNTLFVHNLRKGGFLLAYKVMWAYSNERYRPEFTQFLKKFDADGKQVGVRISENTTNSEWYSLFENENGDYCLFKVYDNYENLPYITVAHECLEDNDFLE